MDKCLTEMFCRDTFADLEQNLQNIMGVNKSKTVTNPSTPTTGGSAPSFPPEQEVIYEGGASIEQQPVVQQPPVVVATSRFQVSPITEERPGNLVLDQQNGRY